MSNFMIDGIGIKNPSSFKIERYNVTNLARLANADMAGDLIAKKKKFYFTYEAIGAEDLNNILALIWDTNELFYRLDYVENGVAKYATVYVGAIPTSLYRADNNNKWLWKDVTFNLIEK